MRYISRVERDVYWLVRVPLDSSAEIVQKVFSDAKYGGKKRALQYARAWRNLVYYEAHRRVVPANGRVIRAVVKTDSGMPGVYRTPGGGYPAWRAVWVPVSGQGAISKDFSISKYGEEEAKRLAMEFREAGVKQVLTCPADECGSRYYKGNHRGD